MTKKNVKTSGYVLVFISIVLSNTNQLSGQEKVSVSAGVGFPEALNIGTRYQLKQSQIGLSLGAWPSSGDWLFDWKSLVSLSGDYYYHFGGPSKYSDLPPWYGRIGLDYFRIGWESSIEHNLESHLRFGRDFYIDENSGISLDAGIGYLLKNATGFSQLIPALGICLFWKF
jgi:hypothetical protein